MSTRILEVSNSMGVAGGIKRYSPSGGAYETFKGIHPGDVLKVIDVGSGDTLITGIMCIFPFEQSCHGCIFDRRTNNRDFSIACSCVPCIDMDMMPRKLEDVLEQL